jgi:hypothetical protein
LHKSGPELSVLFRQVENRDSGFVFSGQYVTRNPSAPQTTIRKKNTMASAKKFNELIAPNKTSLLLIAL